MRDYVFAVFAALIIGALALYTYLDRANIAILNPQGPIALGERGVIFITLALCAIVVVPVFVLLFFFAWKYRDTSPDAPRHHHPHWDHTSGAAEFFWWLVPTAIVAVLAVVAWQSSHQLDPYKPLPGVPAMTVQVVALDWKWLFIYPSLGIASVNLLELPVNQPVRFELTADAPMNSFWIPQLGGQIMVMPGMTTQLNLEATEAGKYNGFSANISGAGFAGMAFSADAVSQDDFNSWVQSVKQWGQPLTSATYSALASPSEYNPVTYYAPVADNLFTAVSMKYMMPSNELPMGGMDMSATSTP